jgi:hypothetical protein
LIASSASYRSHVFRSYTITSLSRINWVTNCFLLESTILFTALWTWATLDPLLSSPVGFTVPRIRWGVSFSVFSFSRMFISWLMANDFRSERKNLLGGNSYYGLEVIFYNLLSLLRIYINYGLVISMNIVRLWEMMMMINRVWK